MYINTVGSLKNSFTDFKKLIYAYVWVQVKEYVYTDRGEDYSFIFRQFVVIGEDESIIEDKAYRYLRSVYPEGTYIITNIIPYKEVFYRELKKEFTDVLKKIHSAQQS